MPLATKAREKRALLTVDLGEEKMKLLDDCHRHVVALDYNGRRELGLKAYGMVTRSSLIRMAVEALYKQLKPTPASKARRK